VLFAHEIMGMNAKQQMPTPMMLRRANAMNDNSAEKNDLIIFTIHLRVKFNKYQLSLQDNIALIC